MRELFDLIRTLVSPRVPARCDGCLVLHRDGEIAYCTEALDGKRCRGYDLYHFSGIMACRVTPKAARCRHCDAVMIRRLTDGSCGFNLSPGEIDHIQANTADKSGNFIPGPLFNPDTGLVTN